MDITVGQKVWIVAERHPAKKLEIYEGEVIKLGRKYVYIKSERHVEYKFNLNTKVESTPSNYRAKLYLSKQAYEDDLEYHDNINELRKLFGRFVKPDVSLDQSRKILAILNEDKATTV